MAVIDLNLSPDDKQLRQFGWIAATAFGLLAGLIGWRGGLFGFDFGTATRVVIPALIGVGMLVGLLAWLAPRANRPLYLGLILLTFPIGFVLSHVIMAALFYGLFTPVALVFRLIRRDPLQRRFDPELPSYWVPPRARPSKESYFQQF